jgi:hypothetical protein
VGGFGTVENPSLRRNKRGGRDDGQQVDEARRPALP